METIMSTMGPVTRGTRRKLSSILVESDNDLNSDQGDAQQLSGNVRQTAKPNLKLKAFIEDFKIQDARRQAEFRKKITEFCNSIYSTRKLAIQNIPREYRNMTVAEFQANGGDFRPPSTNEIDNLISTIIPMQTGKKTVRRKKKGAMTGTAECKSYFLREKQKESEVPLPSIQPKSSQSDKSSVSLKNHDSVISTSTTGKRMRTVGQENRLRLRPKRQASTKQEAVSVVKTTRNLRSRRSKRRSSSESYYSAKSVKPRKTPSLIIIEDDGDDDDGSSKVKDKNDCKTVHGIFGRLPAKIVAHSETGSSPMLSIGVTVPTVVLPLPNGKVFIMTNDTTVNSTLFEAEVIRGIDCLREKFSEFPALRKRSLRGR